VSNPTPLPVSPHVHASAPHRESDATLIRQVRSKQAKIAVIGMGHVGLPTALGFASQGWSVIGADSSLPLISLLQAGKAPFYEPGLDHLLLQHIGKRFFPVENLNQAIREATIIFLCVGTPQRSSGEADLSQVETAARAIAHNLNGYKLIVEKSTVPAITAQRIARTIRRCARNRHPGAPVADFDVASTRSSFRKALPSKILPGPSESSAGWIPSAPVPYSGRSTGPWAAPCS